MIEHDTALGATPAVAPGEEPSTTRLGLGLFAAAVGLIVWATLTFTAYSGRVSPVWIANAVALAWVLRAPARARLRLLLAAFAGICAANLVVGDNVAVAVGLALCNTLEIAVCALLIGRWTRDRLPDVTRLDDLAVVAATASVAPWLSAGLASAGLATLSGGFDVEAFGTWGMADMLGLLIITPVLLALPSRLATLRRPSLAAVPWGRVAAAGALVVAIVVLSAMPSRFPLLLLVLPFALILTLAFEFVGVGLAVAAVALTVVLRPQGAHLFEGDGYSPTEQILLLQAVMALMTLSFAPVAGLLVHRRHSEAGAVEACRRADLAAELAGVGYWRRDPHTGEGYWSDQVFELFGLPRQAGLPQVGDVFERIHPDDHALVRAQHAAAQAGGGGDRFEYRVVRPGGELRTFVGRSTAELDASGRVEAIFGSLMDVTEQRRGEQAVRESEARYRVLADHATDIIARISPDGRILFISPSCLQILGYAPDELVGGDVLEWVHPEDEPALRASFHHLIVERQPQPDSSVQYRARHRDGHWIWLEANPTLIRDAGDKPLEFIDVVRDVTARKAAEAELEQARLAAEGAVKAKADFLSNMSHELRTPLTSIIGFSGLLAGSEAVGETERRYVNRIETASQALLSVINDVLDYSKLEAEGLELDNVPFDPHALLAESLGLLAPQAEGKDLTLSVVMDPGDGRLLLGDGARLRQILLNLLSNAVKFTAEGGVTLRATLADAGGGARRLDVTVADTGIGIAPDQIERLFERFTQADGSISRRFGGTGLGLSIAQRLVQLMGGDITVESRPGQGSEFSFSVVLPLADVELGAGGVGPGSSLAGLRILVCDDLEANRELMTTYLRALDAEVDSAADGAEAVAAVRRQHYDLVLMDVNMPVMDGLAATRAIRDLGEAWSDLPIVALTADVGPGHVARCRAAGMNGHVAKPIVPAELHVALEQTLFRRAA